MVWNWLPVNLNEPWLIVTNVAWLCTRSLTGPVGVWTWIFSSSESPGNKKQLPFTYTVNKMRGEKNNQKPCGNRRGEQNGGWLIHVLFRFARSAQTHMTNETCERVNGSQCPDDYAPRTMVAGKDSLASGVGGWLLSRRRHREQSLLRSHDRWRWLDHKGH